MKEETIVRKNPKYVKQRKTINKKWVQLLYKWHHRIGLWALIPVVFWCVSGLSHPFMANWFKPAIAHEFRLPSPLLVSTNIRSVREVLDMHGIRVLKNFQIVELADQFYYQVRDTADGYRYFDIDTGSELLDGEEKYAEYLARYYLADDTSSIKKISWQTTFDQQYKPINRLLPVWRIDFDRSDDMTLYIETASGRLGTFNPASRKVFLWIFDHFHNWSFLNFIENDATRIAVMVMFLSIIALSAISGVLIYGFLWKKLKIKKSTSRAGNYRRYHRNIGLAVSIVTLTFTFSGAYHVLQKLKPDILPEMEYSTIIHTQALGVSNVDMLRNRQLLNMKLVKNDTTTYYQLFLQHADGGSSLAYVNTQDGVLWENGNHAYATFLAKAFSHCLRTKYQLSDTLEAVKPTETTDITRFASGEYGFVFKRLPVVRLAYSIPGKVSYYIETSSSRLAARIDDSDRREGLSFAILHKFLLMEWAGKQVRDLTTMLAALGILVVSLLGFVLYVKKKKKDNNVSKR